MKNIVTIKEFDGGEIRALEGHEPGSPAVKVEWGYSTGSELGLHSFSGSFACAELGILGADGEFESVVWTEDDLGKRIFTRQVIGWPKEYSGWDPSEDSEDVNWNALKAWFNDYCNRIL